MKPVLFVVEDCPDFARWIEEILGDEWTVESANNYKDASERMRSGGIDLLIMDLTLPDSKFHDTLKKIPAITALVACPVVIMTGHKSKLPDQNEMPPCAALLLKPFNAHDLIQTVKFAKRKKKEPFCLLPSLIEILRKQPA